MVTSQDSFHSTADQLRLCSIKMNTLHRLNFRSISENSGAQQPIVHRRPPIYWSEHPEKRDTVLDNTRAATCRSPVRHRGPSTTWGGRWAPGSCRPPPPEWKSAAGRSFGPADGQNPVSLPLYQPSLPKRS